jgi:ribosomal protein S14
MLSSRVKDLKNRKLFSKIENNRLIYKFVYINLLNTKVAFPNRTYLQYKHFKRFNSLKYRVSTRLLNKCILSNRNSKTFSSYKLSRLVIKELLSFGYVFGYKKSIW